MMHLYSKDLGPLNILTLITQMLFIQTFKNKSWKMCFHKINKQINYSLLRIKQKISMSERFLKVHVTLKTEVMMLKIQLCNHKNKLLLSNIFK